MNGAPAPEGAPILEVRDLCVHFPVRRRGFLAPPVSVRAVEGVSLALRPGETLALVGESGCGKTTLGRAIGLLTRPTAGTVWFEGREVATHRRGLKPVRRRVQMIFQDPYGSLNPRLPVGAIIGEPLSIHRLGSRRERRARVEEVTEAVGLSPSDLERYPHQFSGGQRQRIAIARALAAEPGVVVADEPMSALDVSIQSQVLNLLADLQETHGLTYLLISHDLAVVRHLAERVAVMYLGRVVEQAPTGVFFEDPRHPYARALLAAAPVLGRGKRRPGSALGGEVPSPSEPPTGCPFHPRCPLAQGICRENRPGLEAVAGRSGHLAACHFRDGGGGSP